MQGAKHKPGIPLKLELDLLVDLDGILLGGIHPHKLQPFCNTYHFFYTIDSDVESIASA